MRLVPLTFGIAACAVWLNAAGHPGALDTRGCHPNVAHGSYHCHRGPLAAREYDSREDMVRAYRERERRVRSAPKVPPPAF